MSFTFYCPHCKHKLTVGDDWEGVSTECPHCQASITITRDAEKDDAETEFKEQPAESVPTKQKSFFVRNLVYCGLITVAVLVFGINIFLAIDSKKEASPENDAPPTVEETANNQIADDSADKAEEPASVAENEVPKTSDDEEPPYIPPLSEMKRYEQLVESLKGDEPPDKESLGDDLQPFLMIACRRGDADAVRFLLEAGAEPGEPGKGGLTPVTVAAKAGSLEALKLLIHDRSLVNKNDRTDHAALYYAVSGNHLEIAECLCLAGANVNILQDDETWTPLAAAIQKGSADMVKLLLKHGADLEKADLDGHTPLYQAITSGKLPMVEAILWRRRKLDFHWEDGLTPLMTAIKTGNAQLVKLLLDFDADPNMADKTGERYPITLAEEENNIEIFELLMKYGAIRRKKTQNNTEKPQNVLERLKANSVKNTEVDKDAVEEKEDVKPNGKLRLADIITGEKFRGNMKLVSNMQNKNLPPPYELTQPQKKYGIFVIHPGSSTHQHKSDRLFPSQMAHNITVFFSQKSLRNWGFVMETVKFHKPLEFKEQVWDLIAKNYNLEGNEETTDLQEELATADIGHLGDFVAAATQNKFKESGGPWNQDQIFYNGEFLAVLYSHPYKRFSEAIAQDKKCRLYLLYVDMEMYKKACKELE
ncbi:MAG: ankyrin repeat domain-containing protein [Victivallales bacterium]|nr:ankyrin repeat domain-containing protein [Victivallales bacterium]